MRNFRQTVKMMAAALVIGIVFCSCNTSGGSDAYVVSSSNTSPQGTTVATSSNVTTQNIENTNNILNMNIEPEISSPAETEVATISAVPELTTCIKAVLSGTDLVFYYDNLDHSGEGTVYDVKSTGYNAKGAPWKNSGFRTASFDSSCQSWEPTSMEYFFTGCSSAVSIDCTNLNTSNVNNMTCMFQKCRSLQSLDLSNFEMENILDMHYMFWACSYLESIVLPENFLLAVDETESCGVFDDCPAQIING